MTTKGLILLTAVFTSLTYGTEDPAVLPRICIIGGGMSGSSAGFYLREHYGEGAHIDLYESGTLGGRLATVSLNDKEYESGGSIIHPRNQYMVNFTKHLGLRPREQAGGRMGLYDGRQMVFTTSDLPLLTMAKLLWHYGLSIVYLEDFVSKSLNDFDRIYQHQAAGHAFTTPERLLASMSPQFVTMLQSSVSQYLAEREYDRTFIDQFVSAAMLTNYGQSTDLHAFVGMVSLAGIQPGLWSVHGGNKLVPTELIKASKVNVIDAKVNKVTLLPDGKYRVSSTASEGGERRAEYDVVVVAAPLETSGIQLENLPRGGSVSGSGRKFQRTVATFVQGRLNASRFGFSAQGDLPRGILYTDPELLVSSIGSHDPVDFMLADRQKTGGEEARVWKVFSKGPLQPEDLEALFETQEEVRVVDWRAYPSYSSQDHDQPLPRFELHPHLYYANAMEWAASAMEMSAIAGRNVALLAANRWAGSAANVDTEAFGTPRGKDEL